MSAVTVADTFYDALLDLADAASSITVAVVDADPGKNVPKEFLAFTGITEGEKVIAANAGRIPPQQEMFVVNGEIHAYAAGQHAADPRTVRTKAYDTLRALDTVVQTNIGTGLPAQVLWAIVVGSELQQLPSQHGGRGAVLHFGVHVTAYLTP